MPAPSAPTSTPAPTATPLPIDTPAPPPGFFDYDGVLIHYETFGDGYPIVLVHGFMGACRATGWTPAWLMPSPAPGPNFVLQAVKLLECRGILRDSAESIHVFWKLES